MNTSCPVCCHTTSMKIYSTTSVSCVLPNNLLIKPRRGSTGCRGSAAAGRNPHYSQTQVRTDDESTEPCAWSCLHSICRVSVVAAACPFAASQSRRHAPSLRQTRLVESELRECCKPWNPTLLQRRDAAGFDCARLGGLGVRICGVFRICCCEA